MPLTDSAIRNGITAAFTIGGSRLRPAQSICAPHRTINSVSIERFERLTVPGGIPSLSCWRDEDAVRSWRNFETHRRIQVEGCASTFAACRLRVAQVLRDYGLSDRQEMPDDSGQIHGG
jgi:hypothetical protein